MGSVAVLPLESSGRFSSFPLVAGHSGKQTSRGLNIEPGDGCIVISLIIVVLPSSTMSWSLRAAMCYN